MTTKASRERLLAEAIRLEQAAERALRVRKARDDQIEFIKLLMPDPQGVANGDPNATRFQATPFHRFLAAKLAVVRQRKSLYIALSTPPQHGKSTLTGETFIPWFLGKWPHLNVIYASYSDDRSREVGNMVKPIFLDPVYQEVFPGVELRSDSKAADQMTTNHGGRIAFIGRKGGGTGKPCDLLIIDDPLKDQAEARSPAIVSDLHEWYDRVAETRCHSKTQRLVIQTRWIVDDLIGRLCDPTHPDYDPVLGADWDFVNIPAVVTDPALARDIGLELATPGEWFASERELALVIEQFGDRPMAPLWQERFDLYYSAKRRRKNKRAFDALSMGNPTPEDGDFFSREDIVWYGSPAELPKGMLYYGASDHAITEEQISRGDPACLGCIGVDDKDDVWVLPDLFWSQTGPDGLIEQIMAKIGAHRPLYWFAEQDLIGKTIGPSIRKRMVELKAYTVLHPVTAHGKDKVAKAANAQARVSLRKLHLPKFATWADKAEQQMIRFPNDKNDDFVDFIGIFFRGLDSIVGARAPEETTRKSQPGTIGYLMDVARRADAARVASADLL